MRTILLLALGIFISREVFTRQAEIKAGQRENLARARLKRLLKNELPDATEQELTKKMKTVFGI